MTTFKKPQMRFLVKEFLNGEGFISLTFFFNILKIYYNDDHLFLQCLILVLRVIIFMKTMHAFRLFFKIFFI